MTDKLKIVLKMFTYFYEQELDIISGCFKPKSVTKNSILLHEGYIYKEFYFITKGCICNFFIDKIGYEKTRYIMLDNHSTFHGNTFTIIRYYLQKYDLR